MRNWISLFAVLGFVTLFSACSGTAVSQPSPDEVKAPLSQFLRSENSGIANASITGPDNIRVGEFKSEVGGWPVFADYAISYKENGINITQRGAASSVAAYAKFENGKLVCFTPKFLKQLGKEMDKKFAEAFSSF